MSVQSISAVTPILNPNKPVTPVREVDRSNNFFNTQTPIKFGENVESSTNQNKPIDTTKVGEDSRINPTSRGMGYKAKQAVDESITPQLYNPSFSGITNFDGPRHVGNNKMAGEKLNFIS